MNNMLLIVALMVLMPSVSNGQNDGKYRCTSGALTRRVEIIHETGVTVPCEVHYYKDNESPGERQVLWRAQNEAGYCEAKTAEFIVQLSALGWNCGASISPPEAISEEERDTDVVDDTESLAPAEDSDLPPTLLDH